MNGALEANAKPATLPPSREPMSESDHVRLVLIEQEVRELKRGQAEQIQATRELVEAWRSAKTLLAFIVFLAKVATAIGVVWAVVKGVVFIGSSK